MSDERTVILRFDPEIQIWNYSDFCNVPESNTISSFHNWTATNFDFKITSVATTKCESYYYFVNITYAIKPSIFFIMYRLFIDRVLNLSKKTFVKMSVVNRMNSHNFLNNSFDLEVNRIVWLDMEMTGLDLEQDKIMEVTCLVTDSDLNILAEGPDIIIHQPEDLLNNMNEWCINQHGKTGLTQACLNSSVTVEEADNILLNFVKQYVTESHSPLAGNSVYMDRMFLKKFMPKLNEFLHYRIIDVSTIKEVCRRWNPEIYKQAPKKQYSHRALDDIRESVEELKFYKNSFFKVT